MFWLLFGALLTHAEQPEIKKDIYVAPPTIHDEALREFQPYLNSLLVSSAQSNKHWVRRTHKAKKVNIHDNSKAIKKSSHTTENLEVKH